MYVLYSEPSRYIYGAFCGGRQAPALHIIHHCGTSCHHPRPTDMYAQRTTDGSLHTYDFIRQWDCVFNVFVVK